MVDIVVSVAAKVAEYLVAPVVRQCGYVIFPDSYVRQLEEKCKNLEYARQRMQHSIDEARNDMKLIEADVEKWVTDVETVANKAHDVLENDGRAKKTYFCGWLPNPKARYHLGREARTTVQAIEKLIQEGRLERVSYERAPPGFVNGAPNVNSSACDGGDTVQELIARGQSENPPPGRAGDDGGDTIQELIAPGRFEKDDFENPPPGLVNGAPDVNLPAGDGGDPITDSRASIFQDIMKALDDEKQKVIGIYGPGGVGKTTLLEEVEKKLRKEGRPFHTIVKAKVSQTPDLTKIQYDIAYGLSLNLKDELSEEGRKDLLFKRLQSDPKKILIILDDLWKKLDLKLVGIPSGDGSSRCKLLLTSRFKNVLEQEMGADRTFLLQGLKDEEAFRLFVKKVGDKLKDNEELKTIAKQVVKKLAGLPLLIISVASTLKYRDEHAWRNALIEIDESTKEIQGTIVKLSYDHLKSEDAKYLFLLCGLIGGNIQVERLFVLAMGLGLFGRFNKTMQDSRDRLNNTLDELRFACLLLDGGDDKDYVTIHDLYTEVVGATPFRGQNSLTTNSNYGSWPKEELEKCWAICLGDVGRDRLAELMLCQFPNVKILMLSQPSSQYWMLYDRPDEGDYSGLLDFTCMKELQVLYLSYMHITSLHSSITILRNLRSLNLDYCIVEDVAILGNLKALQILSFVGSTISRLPKEIGELTNLRLLNLSNCKQLKVIWPDVLKGLTNLEELYMKGSFDQWTSKDKILSESSNARVAELKSLKKLTALGISIPNPNILSEDGDLPFGNLTRFWINIGNVGMATFEDFIMKKLELKVLRTMKLKLEGCNSILSKEWVQKALQKTQYLCLDGLRESKKNSHELCIQGFLQLKYLNIQNNPLVKYIAKSSNSAFMILESLFLNNLINLENICSGHIAAGCFSKLKAVRVGECNRLKYLWCLSQMHNLVQLEEIQVGGCDSMRAIARKDIAPADYRVKLPYLRRLHLTKLPNMTSFCTRTEMTSEGASIQAGVVDEGEGDEGTELVTTTSYLQNTHSDSFFDRKVSLPSLEDLQLDSVGSFKRIWPDELSRSSFCKLDTNTVENCSDLLHIFPSTIVGRLHNLKSVKVKNCPSLKSLFDFGSLDSNTEQDAVLLPELVRINVESCPSLESLFNWWSLDSNVEHKIIMLPKLEEVKVSGAKKLSHLVMSHSQMVLKFPSLRTVSVENCSDLRYLFPKYTATSLMKLERLTISKCERMKEVILEKEAGRSEAKVMSFPCLSKLTLEELDNLISFNSGSVKTQLGETAEENDESLQPLFNEMVTFPNIISLEINGLRCKELWNNQIPTDSFQKLEYLLLNNCDNLQRIATSYMWKRLQHHLMELEVISCCLIGIIYEGDGTNTESGKLRRLVLHGLENLRHIWQFDSLPNIPFPNLRDVEAVRCPFLEMLFPIFTAKFLGQIEELVVESCENMELIAGHEKWEEATSTIITFSKLTGLRLFELPKFKSFLTEKYSLKFPCSEDFPSLRVLSIESCGVEPDQVLGDWRDHKAQREHCSAFLRFIRIKPSPRVHR